MRLNLTNLALMLILIVFAGTSFGTCKLLSSELIDALKAVGEIKITSNVSDEKSTACRVESWPGDTLTTAKLVKIAYQHHLAIRTDDDTLKFNGDTTKLIIHQSNLNKIEFNRIGQIRVGAGVAISTLEKVVKLNTGYLLPISMPINTNTTIANLIASGEFGENAHLYGGPWEHIAKITLVTADGKIKQVTKSDALFDWLFGAMNQLGIMTEVDVNLLRSKNAIFKYPLNKKARLVDKKTSSRQYNNSNCVLAFLIPSYKFNDAQADIYRINEQYPSAFKNQEMILFKMTYLSRMPPLIYNKKQSFLGIGLRGIQDKTPEKLDELIKLSALFNQTAISSKYIKYTRDCSTVFSNSSETKNQFREIKKIVDPISLFN